MADGGEAGEQNVVLGCLVYTSMWRLPSEKHRLCRDISLTSFDLMIFLLLPISLTSASSALNGENPASMVKRVAPTDQQSAAFPQYLDPFSTLAMTSRRA